MGVQPLLRLENKKIVVNLVVYPYYFFISYTCIKIMLLGQLEGGVVQNKCEIERNRER